MTGTNLIIMCLLFHSVSVQLQLFEGDRCKVESTGEKGKCVLLDNCDYAKKLLKSRQRPQHCGFKGLMPIVCCPLTTKIIPGEKSEKQCKIYHPKGPDRRFIFLGTRSLVKEFPHMAVLGYGDKNDIQWFCGGSLISEQFVLTAAHCLISRDLGIVKWVRLGDLDIKNETDDANPQDFNITKLYMYPDYKPFSHYHDIALLKLERNAKFDEYTKPACLYVKKDVPEILVVTGWGKLDFLGESSSHLMKAHVNYIPRDQCNERYKNVSKRKLENGVVDSLQICAGHRDGQDTCPGDSGGPLQFKTYKQPLHYYIVGITSFGKACGLSDSVGVYTRVAQYVDWIEDIVWPSDDE